MNEEFKGDLYVPSPRLLDDREFRRQCATAYWRQRWGRFKGWVAHHPLMLTLIAGFVCGAALVALLDFI